MSSEMSSDRQMPGMSRRRFMAHSMATSFLTWDLAGRQHHALGMEPIEREGSHFKFSLAAYSYRNLLQGDKASLTLHDFVDDCARFGLDGTELTSYYFPEDVSSSDLRNLRRHCFRQGLDVSGTSIRNDFGLPAGAEREADLQWVKQWIDRAVVLSAPVIRIFAGHAHGDATTEDVHRRIITGIRECCEYAGQRGIHLALENHGGPTATAEGLLAIVHDVDSPWFGVNLDSGNFRSDDVYGDLQRVAPYAINVQVKVTITRPDGERESTDYRRLAEILRAANYRGYVVLEFEEGGDPRSECPRQLDALRAAFQA